MNHACITITFRVIFLCCKKHHTTTDLQSALWYAVHWHRNIGFSNDYLKHVSLYIISIYCHLHICTVVHACLHILGFFLLTFTRVNAALCELNLEFFRLSDALTILESVFFILNCNSSFLPCSLERYLAMLWLWASTLPSTVKHGSCPNRESKPRKEHTYGYTNRKLPVST